MPADKVRMVDIGDADMVHTNTEYGMRKMLAAGALPVVLGGDHSINIRCSAAFEGQEPFHVVHIGNRRLRCRETLTQRALGLLKFPDRI